MKETQTDYNTDQSEAMNDDSEPTGAGDVVIDERENDTASCSNDTLTEQDMRELNALEEYWQECLARHGQISTE